MTLDELNLEIEREISENDDKLLAAILSIFDIEEDKEIYKDYTTHLYAYLEKKAKLRVLSKCFEEAYNEGKIVILSKYKSRDTLKCEFEKEEKLKNFYRNKLKRRNKPYKFLHPKDGLHRYI